MNQQQESRRAAAQAFIQSLEQLQQTLESVEDQDSSPNQPKSASSSTQVSSQFNLDAWAEAIADIDQYIENRNTSEA